MGGAVNTPSGEIVPCAALPPGIPETLQVTAVLDVFDTVAVNVAASPSSTDRLDGVTTTEIGDWPGGEGGGVGVVAPAQPARSAQSADATQIGAPRHPLGAGAPCGFPEVTVCWKQCVCQRLPGELRRGAPRRPHTSPSRLSV